MIKAKHESLVSELQKCDISSTLEEKKKRLLFLNQNLKFELVAIKKTAFQVFSTFS